MTRAGSSDFSGATYGRPVEDDYARAEQIRASEPGTSMAQQWPDPNADESRGSCGSCQNVGRNERLISAAAGAALAGLGLSRGGLRGLVLGALGGSLVYRGYTGQCQVYKALGINTAKHNDATAVPAGHGYKVERSIVIDRSPEELYSFWRELENLPRIMRHLKRVDVLDQTRSHWIAEGLLGKDVEWDAEIYNERENEMIAWRSLPDSDVDTAGSIHFKRLNNGRGTQLTVSLKYDPPAGKIGATIASLFGSGLEHKLNDDLRNFQRYMETGEIVTNEGQPRGSCAVV